MADDTLKDSKPIRPPSTPMKTFAATVAVSGRAQRIVFDAQDDTAALRIATACNAALVGECESPAALPEAYNEKDARRLLGGVSSKTLWRWCALGYLERLPKTRRVLITRQSIEARKWAA